MKPFYEGLLFWLAPSRPATVLLPLSFIWPPPVDRGSAAPPVFVPFPVRLHAARCFALLFFSHCRHRCPLPVLPRATCSALASPDLPPRTALRSGTGHIATTVPEVRKALCRLASRVANRTFPPALPGGASKLFQCCDWPKKENFRGPIRHTGQFLQFGTAVALPGLAQAPRRLSTLSHAFDGPAWQPICALPHIVQSVSIVRQSSGRVTCDPKVGFAAPEGPRRSRRMTRARSARACS